MVSGTSHDRFSGFHCRPCMFFTTGNHSGTILFGTWIFIRPASAGCLEIVIRSVISAGGNSGADCSTSHALRRGCPGSISILAPAKISLNRNQASGVNGKCQVLCSGDHRAPSTCLIFPGKSGSYTPFRTAIRRAFSTSISVAFNSIILPLNAFLNPKPQAEELRAAQMVYLPPKGHGAEEFLTAFRGGEELKNRGILTAFGAVEMQLQTSNQK